MTTHDIGTTQPRTMTIGPGKLTPTTGAVIDTLAGVARINPAEADLSQLYAKRLAGQPRAKVKANGPARRLVESLLYCDEGFRVDCTTCGTINGPQLRRPKCLPTAMHLARRHLELVHGAR